MVESPRWLLNRNRIKEAYKIVFDHKLTIEETSLVQTEASPVSENKVNLQIKFLIFKLINSYCFQEKVQNRLYTSIKEIFRVLKYLYGPLFLRKRALICHFLWFSASLSYYAIGNT